MKKTRKAGWLQWTVLAVLLLLAVWSMLLAGLRMFDALDAVHPRRSRTRWETCRNGGALHGDPLRQGRPESETGGRMENGEDGRTARMPAGGTEP